MTAHAAFQTLTIWASRRLTCSPMGMESKGMFVCEVSVWQTDFDGPNLEIPSSGCFTDWWISFCNCGVGEAVSRFAGTGFANCASSDQLQKSVQEENTSVKILICFSAVGNTLLCHVGLCLLCARIFDSRRSVVIFWNEPIFSRPTILLFLFFLLGF